VVVGLSGDGCGFVVVAELFELRDQLSAAPFGLMLPGEGSRFRVVVDGVVGQSVPADDQRFTLVSGTADPPGVAMTDSTGPLVFV
jgi:hypothetical protein